MRKVIVALLIIILVIPGVGALSLRDLLRGGVSAALEIFKREISPIDGYKCLVTYPYRNEIKEDYVLVLEGAHFWNPDYHVYVDNATIEFSWWIPRRVDVAVRVYKVYFGFLAIAVEENKDIWWSWWRPYGSKGPGLGAFFVLGFDWKRSGVSTAKKACIAYDLPKTDDILSKDFTEIEILENGSVKVTFENGTEKIMEFSSVFDGFRNMTTGRFEYKHIIGPLYIVRELEEGDEE
ncbi:hypothetical protein [Pyrococcus kukulkanii]|uniref:hypothetical protein n=1 Tax=Pyrococcus kukulkanii TaxID=1609559 RepID=UPI0035658DBA